MSPDRTTPPALGRPPEVTLPPVARRRVAGGIDLVTLPIEGPPVVVLEAIVDAGSAHDPPGSAGLADLTAHLLPEGAASLDLLAIADRLDELGATLSVGTGRDAAWIRLHALASNAGPALSLLADLVVRPTFPAAEVERLLAEREVDLRRQSDDPSFVAGLVFSEALYGADHPYGHPGGGSLASIRGLARSAFEAFYRRRYGPGRLSLLAVGPHDPDALRSGVERAFEGWEDATEPGPDVAPPEEPGRGVVLVDRPDSTQSELRVGHLGVPRDHPDFAALVVLNHLLGGSFHSRLNLNLREKRGWTYGVRSRFSFRRGPGPFVVGTSVEGGATRGAVEEIVGEISRATVGPIEPDERELAVNGITRSLPRMFETAADVAARVREIVIHDLPDDYFARHGERFRAVTGEDLERVAASHLHPDRLLAVVVGDGEAVADDLAESDAIPGPIAHRAWKPAPAVPERAP